MSSCVRTAWLTLGALSVPLEDPGSGYFCQSLDLGAPTYREVVTNRPAQDGADDRTQYMGGRTVTANLIALAGAGATIDAVGSLFAPFMNASARPTLHVILDRPGAAERTLVVRPSGFSNPIVGASERDIQLQFLAADPILRDATTKTATAWTGSSTQPGRLYPLTFPRTYPPGLGSPVTAAVAVGGDVNVRPLCLLYGPITAPQILFIDYQLGRQSLTFKPSVVVAANHFIALDLDAHSCCMDGDPTQDLLAQINWGPVWPMLAPAGGAPSAELQYSGTSTTGVTQAQFSWREGYLS